ncbi:MAG TPA: hypothetical protein VIM25_00765 [Candidatus Limnocylindrales bacterium]
MAIKTIDCVECGESVPYGRLSCPACGALLASVAGARRPTIRTTKAASIATADHEAPEVAAEPVATAEPVAAAEPLSSRPVIEPLLAPEPMETEGTLWPPLVEPAPTLSPRPYQAVEVEHHLPHDTMPTQPSAYRPSTYSPTDGPDWSDATAAGEAAATAATATDAAAATGNSAGSSMIDPARFVEIATWFAIVGAAMAVLGFLLPWSRVVIGASGVGGYFDGWGLASPTHVFVVLGLLAVLAVEILRAPVPTWLRTGIPGLVLGGLIIGLVWPYVVGRLGADIGVLVAGLGGLALIIGGSVASWATRHGEVEQAV